LESKYIKIHPGLDPGSFFSYDFVNGGLQMLRFRNTLIVLWVIGIFGSIYEFAPNFTRGLLTDWKSIVIPPVVMAICYAAIYYGIAYGLWLYRRKFWVVLSGPDFGCLVVRNMNDKWVRKNIELKNVGTNYATWTYKSKNYFAGLGEWVREGDVEVERASIDQIFMVLDSTNPKHIQKFVDRIGYFQDLWKQRRKIA
jgi:hypothetical protein